MILAGLVAAALVAVVPPPASRVSAVADGRVELGTGDLSGLKLAVPGLGVEWRVAPTLAARALALGIAPTGTTVDGRSSHGGAGGDLGIRFLPLPMWTMQPFVAGSAGILLFPSGPFLPGGDLYEFILNFGGGLEVPIGDRGHLGFRLQWAHLSNGQGLGDVNPAFGGFGVAVDARASLEPLDVARWMERPRTEPSPPASELALSVDADLGIIDADHYATGRVRAFEQLGPQALVVVEGEGGSFARLGYSALGLGLVGQSERGSLGAQLSLSRWAGVTIYQGDVQAELRAAPELSFILAGALQSSAFGEFVPLAVGLRAFPMPTFCLDLGTGIDASQPIAFPEGLGPYFGAEWQLPLGAQPWQASLFYERQFAQLNLFGVRVSWGAGESLQASSAHIWRRLR